jgi:hypothetical protein
MRRPSPAVARPRPHREYASPEDIFANFRAWWQKKDGKAEK